MYSDGEGLQWYDPGLLFPNRPLGGLGGDDDGGFDNAQQNGGLSSSTTHEYASQRGFNGDRSTTSLATSAYLSPRAVSRRVQHRARELLLDCLATDTLTSDQDACASVAGLLKSLHTGEPVALTGPRVSPAPQKRSSGQSNPLTDSNVHRGGEGGAVPSFPATLSGATSEQEGRRRRRRNGGASSPLHLLGAGDEGNTFNALFGSESEDAEDFAVDMDGAGFEMSDDEDFSLGAWSGGHGGDGIGNAAAADAGHARDLRAYFTSLPAQLGVQEEPVLCPLNLHTDPIAHVVAAAEVFAVVTATVPQVLYVFDQLNNLPITSSVLGGTSYAAAGSGAGGGRDEGGALLQQSFAKKHAGFAGVDAGGVTHTEHGASITSACANPSSSSVNITPCTIDVADTVQHLWMDPAGQYCVVVFASSKCVYYFIPRRPSAATLAAESSGGGAAASAGAKAKNKRRAKGDGGDGEDGDANDDEGEEDSDMEAGLDAKRRRRQERHREWKNAARQWLRFRRRRRSSSAGDGDEDGETDGADHVQDVDAAYRPRGFSLTCLLPRERGNIAGTSIGSATHEASGLAGSTPAFVPSCVGWSQHLSAPSSHDAHTVAATAAAASAVAAESLRGILKTRNDPSASSPFSSKQLNFNTSATATYASSSSASLSVEALMGARQGGCLVACVLTPAGAVECRVLFQFPTPIAQAPVDSIAAICAPAASPYRFDTSASTDKAVGQSAELAAQGDVGGAASSSTSRHVRWDQATPRSSSAGNDAATSIFPAYAHTPHFLSVDEARGIADEGSAPAALYKEQGTRGLGSGSRGGGGGSDPQQRRRWVVLISVRNRLYVFATPSTTTDFSALEEARAHSRVDVRGQSGAAEANTHTSSLVAQSGLMAASRRCTGRVEDAFALYTGFDAFRHGDAHSQGSGAHRSSLVGVHASSASFARPPLPPTAKRDTPPLGLGKDAAAASTTRELCNFITMEQSAFSALSCAGYTGGSSQVCTTSPSETAAAAAATQAVAGHDDAPSSLASAFSTTSAAGTAAAATASTAGRGTSTRRPHSPSSPRHKKPSVAISTAPFLLESPTRGVVHLVLPPSPPSTGPSGGGLVTPAALPPVFYWQYGDVVVQGIVLCGAGGLEVGSKVLELVHHDGGSTADAGPASVLAFGRTATTANRTRKDEVLPFDISAGTSTMPAHASGLEAGLSAVVDDALRNTQDLNKFAEAAGGKAMSEGRTTPCPPSPTPMSTPPLKPTGQAAPSMPPSTTSSFTQPTVLPIGLLSVLNVNSCLQSLRALLEMVSVTRGRERVAEGGRGDGGGRGRGLTYTRCTMRTTSLTPAQTGEVAGMFSAAPGNQGEGKHVGGFRGGQEEAALLASLGTALSHPSLQFPWTTRLLLLPHDVSKRSATASGTPGLRHHHRHHRHGNARQLSPPRLFSFTAQTTSHKDNSTIAGADMAPVKKSAKLDRFIPSLDVPLLDCALARGDVDADTVRRLRAVARAYVCHSPVLFDAPVEEVLRATVGAAAAAAAAATPSPSLLPCEVTSPSTRPTTASPHPSPSASALSAAGGATKGLLSRQFSSPPLGVMARSSTLNGWPDVLSGDGDGGAAAAAAQASGVHSRSSSTAPALQRANSALSSFNPGESGGRRRDISPKASARWAGDGGVGGGGGPLTNADPLVSPNACQVPASPRSGSDRVALDADGEVLVNFSASYGHLTLTTTQGVYVLAHAAALPLAEAALSWRRALVYHAVTTRGSTTDASVPGNSEASAVAAGRTSASPFPLKSPGAPLFTVIADPAAPDMFYLASRTRIVRLQTPSLSSSAAGRRQFAMQLLAHAAATQPSKGQETRRSAPPSSTTNQTPSNTPLHCSEAEGGRGGVDGRYATAGQRVSAAVSEALHNTSAMTETVVVPSSLSYELRLKECCIDGESEERSGAVQVADRVRGGGDDDAYGLSVPFRSPRGTNSNVDGDNGSWRSSHPSRSNSAQRHRVPFSAADSSTGGSRSDAKSTDPSPLSVKGVTRMGELERPKLTIATSASMTCADERDVPWLHGGTGALPRARSTTDVGRLHALADGGDDGGVGGAAHFLRHAHRRALPPRLPSTTSLPRNDSFDLPFSSSTYGQAEHQHQAHGAAAAMGTAGVRGTDVVTLLPTHSLNAVHAQLATTSGHYGSGSHDLIGHGGGAGSSADVQGAAERHQAMFGSTRLHPLHVQSAASFTHYASPLQQETGAETRAGAAIHQQLFLSPDLPITNTRSAMKGKDVEPAAAAAAAVAALGAASRAEDRDLATFLGANPLLHYLLQRSSEANGNSATLPSHNRMSAAATSRSAAAAQITSQTRAVNIPGFGVLPGSVGLTPLTQVGSRAVASLLLQKPIGASYYCADHLYELALAACCAAQSGLSTATSFSSSPLATKSSRRPVVTREDVCLMHLVRHAYGGYLLSQHRYLEAAVQFGKAVEGPTPFTTVLIEMVRAFRDENALEPLALFLRLRLRAWEESPQGLGGHGMEVSVLATWLLSLCLEQCSIARSKLRRCEADGDICAAEGRQRDAHSRAERRGSPMQPIARSSLAGVAVGRVAGMLSEGTELVDFTRVAWIRRRYHLDHPTALLEDTLLRYSRFVDWTVLSTSVARLASAREAVLVSELQGSPEKTVMGLVLREQNYFAGLLRLQALLADPTSQSAQTRRLLQSLICVEDAEGGRGGAPSPPTPAPSSGTGTMPLLTVFYQGGAGTSQAPLPAPRDTAALPRTLATLFERMATMFLCCYPCRFVQEGLLALLHQRQDVPLPPRRLLPALLTYSLANNESVFEATGSPAVVLQALTTAKNAQRLPLTFSAHNARAKASDGKRKRREKAPKGTVGERAHCSAEEEPGAVRSTRSSKAEHLKQPAGDMISPVAEGGEKRREGIDGERSCSAGANSLLVSLHARHAVVDPPRPPSSAPASIVDLALPPSSSSSSASPSFSQEVSQHDTKAYNANEASFLDHIAPALMQDLHSPLRVGGQVAYDHVLLDDSSSEGEGVDEDIVLPKLPNAHRHSTSESDSINSNKSCSRSGNDVDTATPSSPRRRGSGGEKLSSLFLSEPRTQSSMNTSSSVLTSATLDTATAPSVTHREADSDTSATSSSSSSSSGVAALLSPSLPRGAPEVIDPHNTISVLPQGSSAKSSTTSDAVEDLLATSETSNITGSIDEEVDEGDSDFDMEELSPFIDLGEGSDCGAGFFSGDEERANARVLRARQKRAAAALHMRHALTPVLTSALVAAAVAGATKTQQPQQRHDGDGDGAGGGEGLHLPVPEHAVLCYLGDLVVHQGSPMGCLEGADVAVFVAYVNVLARDGEEEALQKFTEKAALEHIQQTDTLWSRAPAAGDASASSAAAAAATTSSYRLLHVLRLCAAHRRWVGCVWMYYALGYYREAVEVALAYVVGEEGVRLAVRLLQLLHERDRRHGQAARQRDVRFGRQGPSSGPTTVAAHNADVCGDYTQRQEVRRTRRDLWMLVARYLIQGGGHTKHGAQTALQLSLRSGGDTFNVTDVLPELPDTLFMAELKEELLSSVRELSHKMRGLRVNTNALGRDTRILHREVQAISNQPLSMQVDERCVLCGQPALARPFTVYPRCRHLIHTSCYHHAHQAMMGRRPRGNVEGEEEAERRASLSQSLAISKVYDSSLHGAEGHGHAGSTNLSQQRIYGKAVRATDGFSASSSGALADDDGAGAELAKEPAEPMECLLCARRYLRTMLDAPLHVSLVGDDVQSSSQRVVLR